MVLSTEQILPWNLGMFTNCSWTVSTDVQSCKTDPLLCAGSSAAATSVNLARLLEGLAVACSLHTFCPEAPVTGHDDRGFVEERIYLLYPLDVPPPTLEGCQHPFHQPCIVSRR